MIVITAGHSNVDPGAVANGIKEADFAADMRNYVAYYLRNWGFEVQTDGEGRTNAPLTQAIQLAKKAQLAVEFHLNASSTYTAYGVECLSQVKDRELSQKIAKAIADVTGSRLRGSNGWQPEDAGQHTRLGFVRAGGIIVELEFVTCQSRMNTLNEKRWLVAKAIAEEIRSYMGK
jgi:N-acetylmuramoyl-L-alanine amidase